MDLPFHLEDAARATTRQMEFILATEAKVFKKSTPSTTNLALC